MVIHYSSLSQIIPKRIGLVLSGPTVGEWMGWSGGNRGGFLGLGDGRLEGLFFFFGGGLVGFLFKGGRKGVASSL